MLELQHKANIPGILQYHSEMIIQIKFRITGCKIRRIRISLGVYIEIAFCVVLWCVHHVKNIV
jgi:hypothetical protein